jgi:hypothetical protein|tara:strand:- start:210 stop:440 length:231 start_codon:yes stop_codon:yes gene_type:complete
MIVKFKKFIPFIFFFSFLLLVPQITFAYIGPGIALGTIITLLAVVGLFILALLSVIYYPIKRLIKRLKSKKQSKNK